MFPKNIIGVNLLLFFFRNYALYVNVDFLNAQISHQRNLLLDFILNLSSNLRNGNAIFQVNVDVNRQFVITVGKLNAATMVRTPQ